MVDALGDWCDLAGIPLWPWQREVARRLLEATVPVMNPDQFGGQVGHFGGLDLYSHYMDEYGQLFAVANRAQMDALMRPMKFTPEMVEKLLEAKPSDEEMARQAEEIMAPKFHFKSF